MLHSYARFLCIIVLYQGLCRYKSISVENLSPYAWDNTGNLPFRNSFVPFIKNVLPSSFSTLQEKADVSRGVKPRMSSVLSFSHKELAMLLISNGFSLNTSDRVILFSPISATANKSISSK